MHYGLSKIRTDIKKRFIEKTLIAQKSIFQKF